MNHTELLKRSAKITWRYRPLWLFGFLLALCSGGSGGSGNFSSPSSSMEGQEFGFPSTSMPDVDPGTILAIIGALLCLVLLLAVVGVIIRAVTRTAIIGMVDQIADTEAVTVRDGWQFGWSARAWRLFLVGLVIGIPVAIISIVLILLAMSPLLLLAFSDSSASIAVSIIFTILAVLLVILVLMVVGAIVAPIMEIAWRRTVLHGRGVIDSLSETFAIIKQNLKDVFIVWLLLFGVSIAWGILTLIALLPVSIILALIIGGIPAGLVYLVSSSWVGAAVTGIPLAVIVMILVMSAATALYLIFHSSVWTLAYREFGKPDDADAPVPLPGGDEADASPPATDLLAEADV